MDSLESLGGSEFPSQTQPYTAPSTRSTHSTHLTDSTHSARSATAPPGVAYLNTASAGLGPARAAVALRRAVDAWTVADQSAYEPAVTAARASFARLVSVPVERVAVGSAVSVHVGLIASALPPGAEVLAAEGDFSSLVNPFAVRRDLKLRVVPLESIADEVRGGTSLVAVSVVQSADGRVADLAAIREAAARHGARTLIDATQSVGWRPMNAALYDYVVVGAFKWLLCPRGVSFLVVGESAADELAPIFAGWSAGADPWLSTYGPVAELADSARRFDISPPYIPYVAAEQSLALIEETGVERIGAHDTALAGRFRAGLDELGIGYAQGGAGDSPIVAVRGLGDAAAQLARAGVLVSPRAGHLRASFHLYNSAADVDKALDVLGGLRRTVER
ncbi:aminotransferase class V-fold PLP-dependent enzyme [Streptomyces sp. RB6PN25]|uniref:Aminotransferase class V-fold PLP-dependent enzyme n=2 Tax=Streptomyces humicola TaxID=2953240 RepID=A0ABT1PY81_9ACTN|nr:aminotransferase class V-fold PLP-dependent enzyme [Streptomyces humicola]